MRTEHVRVEHRPNVGFARFLDRTDEGITGIVEDYVEPAEVLVRLPNGITCLIGIGHVKRHRKDGVAEALLQIGNGRQFAGSRRDLVASLECRLGPDATETARGACDKPDFVSHSIRPRTAIHARKSKRVPCR